ncbi:MAG: hypothetical protein KAT35_05070 [Candidatus Aenigmarchaeota archaeon]|nr:hypothetical protein [Candidatus Aenigmarchaeota archaeon]
MASLRQRRLLSIRKRMLVVGRKLRSPALFRVTGTALHRPKAGAEKSVPGAENYWPCRALMAETARQLATRPARKGRLSEQA